MHIRDGSKKPTPKKNNKKYGLGYAILDEHEFQTVSFSN